MGGIGAKSALDLEKFRHCDAPSGNLLRRRKAVLCMFMAGKLQVYSGRFARKERHAR